MHFASWRERIFAGYLTVLAALGFAFSKETSIPVRAAVFAFGILVSAVFRILDFRTTDIINLCQDAGESLEGSGGFYGEINERRFDVEGRASYALAIDTLVTVVVGASATGLAIYLLRWRRVNYTVGPCWSIVTVTLILVLWIGLRTYTKKIWSDERTAYKARPPKAGRPTT
jgi:hypothetical protein